MRQYLLSIYQPDGEPPASLDMDRIERDVGAWRQELVDAGAFVFTAGLNPASSATVLRPCDGDVLVTDGPYAEGSEHIGGFTIIEAPDLDEALEWARKGALATTLPIEVRPMQP